MKDRPEARALALTLAALVSFALNSLLCRAALGPELIDPWTFTLVRLGSGAAVLFVLVHNSKSARPPASLTIKDRIFSAVALFLYALPFSLAYARIATGTGAFVVFGCVQVTMIGSDLFSGRSLRRQEAAGLGIALIGLGWLTRPGVESPDPSGVLLMAVSGVSWGIYSLRGRFAGPPVEASARNFAAAVPLAVVASGFALPAVHLSAKGLVLALLSGAFTSGLGYVAWYAALPSLSATRASIVQLAVPPLAAALGIVFLGETLTPRLMTGAPMILGGIALAVTNLRR